MANEFKIGDEVKFVKKNGTTYWKEIGSKGIVIGLDTSSNYCVKVKFDDGETEDYYADDLYLIRSNGKKRKEVTPKFLLQYEIDEDPFEEFQTIAEVKKRIKALVAEGGHSFVLWEIKKKTVLDVSKVESVVIKGI